MQYRDVGKSGLAIVSEKYWTKEAKTDCHVSHHFMPKIVHSVLLRAGLTPHRDSASEAAADRRGAHLPPPPGWPQQPRHRARGAGAGAPRPSPVFRCQPGPRPSGLQPGPRGATGAGRAPGRQSPSPAGIAARFPRKSLNLCPASRMPPAGSPRGRAPGVGRFPGSGRRRSPQAGSIGSTPRATAP